MILDSLSGRAAINEDQAAELLGWALRGYRHAQEGPKRSLTKEHMIFL